MEECIATGNEKGSGALKVVRRPNVAALGLLDYLRNIYPDRHSRSIG